jgi:hypothetical protein
VFPVMYALNSYILFRRNQVFKELIGADNVGCMVLEVGEGSNPRP